MKQLTFFTSLDELIDMADVPANRPKKVMTREEQLESLPDWSYKNPLYFGPTKGPRAKGMDKITDGLRRAQLVTNVAMLKHVINWLGHQGVTMESLAGQDASEKVIDLLIESYMNRTRNYEPNAKYLGE